MQSAPAVPLAGWAERTSPGEFCQQTLAVAEAEIKKLRHDPLELLTRAVQPTLWLLIFGEVFTRVRDIPTGGLRYLDFMAPGILAQSVLFGAIFYGVSLIWERDAGILQKFLVSPASRTALVAGRALSSSIRSIFQGLLIYVIAWLLGVALRFEPWRIAAVLLAVMLGSATFSTFSLIAACLVKSRERFMGIGQVLTMPLFFASNAIYPLTLMPSWLRTLALINPLSYQVDLLRALMVRGGESVFGIGFDLAVQCLALVLLLAIAAKLYPRIAS